MSSTKNNSQYVSKRVQQTKKEIEQLKEELQKLINRGTSTCQGNESKTSLETDCASTSQAKRPQPTNVKLGNVRNITVRSIPSTQRSDVRKDVAAQEVSPKKVRHYNVDEAREYIRKQREKRTENLKLQVKESLTVVDIRKEKLMELRKKSLELVQKNITYKRDRSRSKDKRKVVEQECNKFDTNDKVKKSVNCNKNGKAKGGQVGNKSNKEASETIFKPQDLLNNNRSVPDLINNVKTYEDINTKSQNQEEEQNIAANKIQRYFRKYMRKKVERQNHDIYRNGAIAKQVEIIKENYKFNRNEAISAQGEIEKQHNYIDSNGVPYRQRDVEIQKNYFNKSKIINMQEHIDKQKHDLQRKANIDTQIKSSVLLSEIKTNEDVPLKQTTAVSEPNLFHKNKFDVPVWLQPKAEPYPCNFISAVRRKLNFAVNTPNDNSEREIFLDESKIRVEKVKNDIKKSLEESMNKNHISVQNIRYHALDNFLLNKNEMSGNKSDKTLNTFLSKKCLDLDLRRVEELRLYKNGCDRKSIKSSKSKQCTLSESSESDTSKNIPDISTETSISKHSVKSNFNRQSRSEFRISTSKINDLKLIETPLITLTTSEDFGKDIVEKFSSRSKEIAEQFSSKSADNVSKQISNYPLKSKSMSNVSDLTIERSTDKPSPLQVPNINLVETHKFDKSNNETSNDLRSFLDYMSSLENSKRPQAKSKSESKILSSKSQTSENSKSRTSKFDSFISLPQTSPRMDSIKTVTERNPVEEKKSDSYSSSFSGSTATVSSVPSLKRPSATLTTSQKSNSDNLQIENPICIKPGEIKHIDAKTNTNQIHLKFEAELHLLNDFNESLRQFMAVEKTILDLHSKNQSNTTIHQNQDTQTSAQIDDEQSADQDVTISMQTEVQNSHSKGAMIATVNYSRGTDMSADFDEVMEESSIKSVEKKERSLVSLSLNLSQLDDIENSTVDDSVSNISVSLNESYTKNVFAGLSVGMFDQLIKDEDARIENLKTILKIREKALLDRTKGELAWLEIQKKQLIETGHLQEASLLKKKQRGIIIKLQHERQEMQRLKQLQKQASKERKIVLKEQRNMIKAQLSNNSVIPKIKRSAQKDRRQSGPIKVYNLHRETINTETSISRRNSVAEEIIITSRSESVVGQIAEDNSADQDSLGLNTSIRSIFSKRTENAKKALLMREAALQKRKKAAEDLLQWHQRLLEEERKIAELEMAANTIIKQVPTVIANKENENEEHNFKGSQLNLLWLNMTGRKEKKFNDDKSYSLSQVSLQKFCKEAKKVAGKGLKITASQESSSDTSVCTEHSVESKYSTKSTTSNHSIITEGKDSSRGSKNSSYSSDFHEISEEKQDKTNEISKMVQVPQNSQTVQTELLENEIGKSKSTLNEIMQNISTITDEISAIYKLSTAVSSSNEINNSSKVISEKSDGRTSANTGPAVSNASGKVNESSRNLCKPETNESSQDKTSNVFSDIKSKSEVVSDKLNFEGETNDHLTATTENKISEDIISKSENKITKSILESLNEKPSENTMDSIQSEISPAAINILSQKSISLTTNLDEHINEILSEGTKRINEILSGRSQITSDKITGERFSQETNERSPKTSDIFYEKSERTNSKFGEANEQLQGDEVFNDKSTTIDALSEINKDMSFLSDDNKQGSEVISESRSKPNDGFSEKCQNSEIDEIISKRNISSGKNKKEGTVLSNLSQETIDASIENNLENKIQARKEEIPESEVASSFSNRCQNTSAIVSDPSQKTNDTFKENDVFSENNQKSYVISTGNSQKSNSTSNQGNQKSDYTFSEENQNSNFIAEENKKSNILCDKSGNTSNIVCQSSHETNDTLSDINQEVIISVRCQKTYDSSNQTISISPESTVLDVSFDDVHKTNDTSSEVRSSSKEVLSNNEENIASTDKSRSINATVLKTNESSETPRTKNESLSSNVELIKTLTDIIKTNNKIEIDATPESKNMLADSPAALISNSELFSSPNELKVEINDIARSQNKTNSVCQMKITTNASNINLTSMESDVKSESEKNIVDIYSNNFNDSNEILVEINNEISENVKKHKSQLIEKTNNTNELREHKNIFEKESWRNSLNPKISKGSIKEEIKNKYNEKSTLSDLSSLRDDSSKQKNLENSNSTQISKSAVIFTPLKTLDHSTDNKFICNNLEGEVPKNFDLSIAKSKHSILSENTANKNTSNHSKINGHTSIITESKVLQNVQDIEFEKLSKKSIPEIDILDDNKESVVSINLQSGKNKFNELKNSETSEDFESILTDQREVTNENISNCENALQKGSNVDGNDLGKSPLDTDDDTTISSISQSPELKFDNEDSHIKGNIIVDKSAGFENFGATTENLSSTEHTTDSVLKTNENNSDLDKKPLSENKSHKKITDVKTIEKSTTDEPLTEKTNSSEEDVSRSPKESSTNTKTNDNLGLVDVKKRVSQILADANSPRGARSPRLQDIYTTTYDILSPDRSPEMGSPVSNEKDLVSVTQLYGEEAEALFKKQLAIEQEIKQLEQQQKEQIPYIYMREIPNKPPPPYTPPVAQSQCHSTIPSSLDQLDKIICDLSRVLHNSYFKGTLETATLSERDKRSFTSRNSVDKDCYEFVFDVCKELAVEHYRLFADEPKPSWMRVNQKFLSQRRPFNELELRQYLFEETKVLLGFEKVVFKEGMVTKWSRKKRDHVDEILVMESQVEESEWTNYDEDEVIVKNELTNDIMNMLLFETAQVLDQVLKKKLTQRLF